MALLTRAQAPAGARVPSATLTSPTAASFTPLQARELEQLSEWHERGHLRTALEKYPKALTHLAARGIGPSTVFDFNIGYVPDSDKLTGPIARWRDRLIFPIASPHGQGFFGYALQGWETGMTPWEHVWAFEGHSSSHNLWEHSGHIGWFGTDMARRATHWIIVRDLFDALVIAPWLPLTHGVVATDGFSFYPDWLPPHLGHVTLAFAGIGTQLAELVERALGKPRFHHVPPPADAPSWSACYQARGYEGLEPLLGAWEIPATAEPIDPARVICADPAAHAHQWTIDQLTASYRCPVCPRY